MKTLSIAGGAILLLITLSWVAFGQFETMRTITYVIPQGTKQSLETGRPGTQFPDTITMTVGLKDTIVIENQDDVIHAFGPFVVAPHSKLRKRFDTPIVYEGACTFHQDAHMRVVVNPAPWDFSVDE
ncbi:MAG: hypothetical protein KDJ52_11945 [Anaerolineae bacterium]|nr:hypothetical protein [Anaerolineae bacterium]